MSKYAYPKRFFSEERRWPSAELHCSPVWCAVDLRDGNQALSSPLTPQAKETYFNLLLAVGFKEIEIGFPAASIDEWTFCRDLIEGGKIPQNVTVSVLSQAREHIIARTMDALRGVRRGICHIYVPTSELHREFVLHETKEELRERVLASVRQVRALAQEMKGSEILLEFSPEEFTDSDIPEVAALCDEVVRCWNPTNGEKVIINLPATVERALPNHYPDMIERFCELAELRSSMLISLHAHNDMGCAVASTELALLAGGERVEGTLFGNGERCGNVDLVTLAMNLAYLGLDTGLDFSWLERLSAEYTELTGLPVAPRQPYAGDLVFTTFSGSHQDAIHKALSEQKAIQARFGGWKLPYFHIDPTDVGRTFDGAIRINSQSGKGGIAHVLSECYGIQLPDEMLAELAVNVQERADATGGEVRPEEVWQIFLREFDCQEEPLRLVNYWPRPDKKDPSKILSEVHLLYGGERWILRGAGDGPVAAFADAIRKVKLPPFRLLNYEERSIGTTVNAEAITVVSLEHDHRVWYGVGFGANIVHGAARAIISGLNRMMREQK